MWVHERQEHTERCTRERPRRPGDASASGAVGCVGPAGSGGRRAFRGCCNTWFWGAEYASFSAAESTNTEIQIQYPRRKPSTQPSFLQARGPAVPKYPVMRRHRAKGEFSQLCLKVNGHKAKSKACPGRAPGGRRRRGVKASRAPFHTTASTSLRCGQHPLPALPGRLSFGGHFSDSESKAQRKGLDTKPHSSWESLSTDTARPTTSSSRAPDT